METLVHCFLSVFFLFHLEESHKRSDGDALFWWNSSSLLAQKSGKPERFPNLEENGEENDSDGCGNKKRLTGDATRVNEENQSEGDCAT